MKRARSSSPEVDNDQLSAKQIVEWVAKLNTHFLTTKQRWFVCNECGELIVGGSPTYLATSKWGYERPFCEGCTLECSCGETHSHAMAYKHEGCDKIEDKSDDLEGSLTESVSEETLAHFKKSVAKDS